ncbi:MAG TPA: DUF3800 domain-containing protein [Nitrospiraceae bacterium]|nr:DUF3800 domain-containing protein [Nitrospiraceae bacterium]
MMLTFYGDESGTHDRSGTHPGSDVIAVAGYLAHEEDWKHFQGRWTKCLNKYHVDEFHLARFMRDKELPYRNWSKEKRDEFINELIAIARRHTCGGFGGLVVVDDYNKILPAQIKREHKHPYYFCFQMLIDILLSELDTLHLPAGEQVAFIFEQNQQFADGATESYKRIKQFRDKGNRLGSITFGSRKQHVPLQAADLIAYTIRAELSRFTKAKPRPDWGMELSRKKNLKIVYCSKDGLERYVQDIKNGKIKHAVSVSRSISQ